MAPGNDHTGVRQSACRRLLRWGLSAPLFLALILFQNQAIAASSNNPANQVLQQNQTQFKQFNRETEHKQKGPVVITSPANRNAPPPSGGPTVLLKSVTFEPPSAFLSKSELNAIRSRYVGKKVDFSKISALVRDVNDLYAKKGIVTASAILPPQKLTSGHLKVQLVEGKVGTVSIVGKHRTSDKYIFERVRLAKGNTVDVPLAAKDITYFNKTSQAQLRLLLQPGATFGLTDLALGITEPPTDQLYFFVDNDGVDSTGNAELGAYYRKYGLLGIDDNLTFYAVGSPGSLSGTFNYDFPLTVWGTRLALGYTRSGISVINGPEKPLDVTGASQAASATILQPLYVTKDWDLTAVGSEAYTTSTSKSGDVSLVDSDTEKSAIGLSLSYQSTSAQVSLQPQLIYADAHDRLNGSSRDILLGAGTVSASYQFNSDYMANFVGAWQVTGNKLLPGDLLFQIGGPNSVRGYPTDAVAGDSGYFGQFELHKKIPHILNGLDLYAFSDIGEVFSTFPANTLLVSAGAGVAVELQKGLDFNVSVGFPLRKSVSHQSEAEIYARLTVQAF